MRCSPEGRPGGQKKVPSEGVAVAFPHWESSRGVVHGHIHYAVPNITWTKDGEAKSIANAGVMFKEQGVMRAASNKRMDDLLQDRGFITRREGKTVAIAGIPDEMVARLSPSRAAMDEAKKQKGFSGPRAQDFYARQARREAGPRTLGDPKKLNQACWAIAREYGVTQRTLKRPADSARFDADDRIGLCIE